MKVEITRTIICDDNKKFGIGYDVGFTLMRNDKEYNCIGEITDITEDNFTIKNVELDRMYLGQKLTVKYSEVKDEKLHHVYCD